MKRENCKVGMPVLYVKGGEHIELGIIKSFNREGVPFVCYHTGSTAACTPYHMLRPVFNEYAFQIIRKDVNNEIETQKARRMAIKIIEKLNGALVLDYVEGVYIDIVTSIIENFKEVNK